MTESGGAMGTWKPGQTTVLCELDSGPLHGVDVEIPFDETGELPTLLVTDEGDYWSLYVRTESTRYRYDGEPSERELSFSPRVPKEGRR